MPPAAGDGAIVGREETDNFKDGMQGGESNIMVAVRVRPLLPHELNANRVENIKVLDGKVVVCMDPAEMENNKGDILRANRSKEKRYAFDHAFDSSTTQSGVYSKTTQFLIEGILNGYNATVFAYGATGAGKTHTMLGAPETPGIMVLTLRDLFQRIRKRTGHIYKVTLSYLEVYNEVIRDLLRPSDEYLDLREDPLKGMVVAGISELTVSSADEIMDLLRRGNRNRTTESTGANEVSSRSHAVLQVIVEHRDKVADTSQKLKVGKLSLIDLAGSERASTTNNRGARLIEGANINRSLLALGNCINALGEKGNKGRFVPYRDSKLTRLLKDSLGGNCRTVMIANISPARTQFEETLNTLKYANRAKNIKTTITRNVLNVSYHVAQYTQIIADLRSEIGTLQAQLADVKPSGAGSVGQPEVDSLEDELEKEQMLEIRNRIISNFQERMQLRKSLIEIEDQNLQNNLNIGKGQIKIRAWEQDHPNDVEKPPRHIADLKNDIKTVQDNIKRNEDLKKEVQNTLTQLEVQSKKLEKELPKRISNRERREFLELEYRIHLLELENLELEANRLMNEGILKEREMQIHDLVVHVQMRDKVIEQQVDLLESNDVDHAHVVMPPKLLLGDENKGFARSTAPSPTGAGGDKRTPSPLPPIITEAILTPARGAHQKELPFNFRTLRLDIGAKDANVNGSISARLPNSKVNQLQIQAKAGPTRTTPPKPGKGSPGSNVSVGTARAEEKAVYSKDPRPKNHKVAYSTSATKLGGRHRAATDSHLPVQDDDTPRSRIPHADSSNLDRERRERIADKLKHLPVRRTVPLPGGNGTKTVVEDTNGTSKTVNRLTRSASENKGLPAKRPGKGPVGGVSDSTSYLIEQVSQVQEANLRLLKKHTDAYTRRMQNGNGAARTTKNS